MADSLVAKLGKAVKRLIAEDTGKATSYSQPEEFVKLANRIKDDCKRSYDKKDALGRFDAWKKAERFMSGDHWFDLAQDVESEHAVWPVTPFLASTADTIISHMVDGEVFVSVLPPLQVTDPRDAVKRADCDLIATALKANFLERQGRLKIEVAEDIRITKNIAFYKALIDPDLDAGLGNLDFEVIDPSLLEIDPNVTAPWDLQRASFIAYRAPRSLSFFHDHDRDEWPHGIDVQPDSSFSETDPEDYDDTEIAHNARAMYTEYWWKDADGLHVAEMGGWANPIILRVRHNPYGGMRDYPFAACVMNPRSKRLWSESLAELLAGKQRIVDKYEQLEIEDAEMNALGIMFVGQDAGYPDVSKIPYLGGTKVPTQNIQAWNQWKGTAPNPNIGRARNEAKAEIDAIAGTVEIMRGVPSQAGQPATTSAILDQRAAARTRRKQAHQEDALAELFRLWVGMMPAVYTEPRYFIAKRDGVEDYVRFDAAAVLLRDAEIADENPVKEYAADAATEMDNPEDSASDAGDEAKSVRKDKLPLQFRIKVEIGQATPLNQLWQFEQAVRMRQLGLADDEFVLDNAPLKGIEELKQRRLAAASQAALPGVVPGQNPQAALSQGQPQPKAVQPAQPVSLAGIPDEAVDAYLASLSPEQRRVFEGMTREQIVAKMEEMAMAGAPAA
ncbi:MAG: hypothetical protein AB1760_00255 [Pseudomonadota bacterium]